MQASVIIRAMGSALRDLVPEPLRHVRRHELAHVAAKLRDLAHQRCRNEEELLGRRHEHGLVDLDRDLRAVAQHLGQRITRQRTQSPSDQFQHLATPHQQRLRRLGDLRLIKPAWFQTSGLKATNSRKSTANCAPASRKCVWG